MAWWQYLILVNIYLVLFYGFYVMLLGRETFFQLNRIYLVAGALLSFLIPVIQSNWVKNLFITQKVKYTIYTNPVMFYQFKPIRNTHITLGQLSVILYIAGILFFLARFIWQLAALRKIIDQPKSTDAYSFFKKIRMGDELQNNQVIAAHESVHARQWHSADILLIEAVMIINWFNPVVYLYRLAVKHIHEFIADRQAIKTGTDKEAYALLLLSQTFNTQAHRLVNPFFNSSLLKKRIKMLQKSNSQGIALIKYGLSAPLFVLMLILSSATVNNSKPVRLFNKKAEQVFLTPAVTDSDETKTEDLSITDDVIKSPEKTENLKLTIPASPVIKTPGENNKPVFTSVEQVPNFPGGINAFYDFLGRNINYPSESREKGDQGRVIVNFIVEADGSLSNINVAHGIDNEIDQETVRVLKLSPKWNPGIQNGKPVRVGYSVPIAFTLNYAQPKQMDENKVIAVNENILNTVADTGKKTTDLKNQPSQPMYILDGKQVDNIRGLSPDDIKSIDVVHDKSAIIKYGPKAVGGVLIITSKNSNKATHL